VTFRGPGEKKRDDDSSHACENRKDLMRRVDEVHSAGKPPLDATIETRLNLIMIASRVISSVKIAASGSRHLKQDPEHVYSEGSRRHERGGLK